MRYSLFFSLIIHCFFHLLFVVFFTRYSLFFSLVICRFFHLLFVVFFTRYLLFFSCIIHCFFHSFFNVFLMKKSMEFYIIGQLCYIRMYQHYIVWVHGETRRPSAEERVGEARADTTGGAPAEGREGCVVSTSRR